MMPSNNPAITGTILEYSSPNPQNHKGQHVHNSAISGLSRPSLRLGKFLPTSNRRLRIEYNNAFRSCCMAICLAIKKSTCISTSRSDGVDCLKTDKCKLKGI